MSLRYLLAGFRQRAPLLRPQALLHVIPSAVRPPAPPMRCRVQPGNSAAFNETQAKIKRWVREWVILDRPSYPPHQHHY